MTAVIGTLTLPLSRGPLRRALEAGVGALLVVGVIAVGVAYATTRPVAPLAVGTARLVPGDAAVTVRRGSPSAGADSLLRAGDGLVVEHGVATVRTAAGVIYARAGTAIVFTRGAPRIERGDVVVHGKEFAVAMRSATADITGIARVRQGLTLEIGMYRGGAVVRTISETLGLPHLRRAIVAGAGGPAAASIAPLVIDPVDEWDRKFLGDAIELDVVLSARSRGLTMQVAGGGNELLRQVLATPEWKDALAVLGNAPIGEVVVAAELARAAHLPKGAVASALKLRDQGASWGLIAFEQGVRSVPAPFAGLDNVVVPTIAPAVVPGAPAVTTPTVVAPVGGLKVPVPTTLPLVPKVDGGPGITVPPSPTDNEPTVVVGLVETVGDILGGLLGH